MKTFPKKIKILYLVNQFRMHGGIQRMLSHKIDAWIDECQYDVVIITINQDNAPVIYPPQNKFKLIDLDLPKVNKQDIKALYSFGRILKKLFKSESPDLIITTLTGLPSLILPFICPEIKKVLEIHSSGELSVTPIWKYKWPFLNRYHRVILLNEDEKNYYNLTNLAVIPNFIPSNDGVIDYVKRENRIIAAGRIHADKQYNHLIKIWKKVFVKYPTWNLDIYGNGDKILLNKYETYIKDHKIERVTFHPATNNIDEELMKASILCLTSATECFPMILIECKKMMLPVVSYDSPNGPRHIIKDDGILVEHNNIEKFAQELELLIENEELRKKMALKAKENISLFSAKIIIEKWNLLLK